MKRIIKFLLVTFISTCTLACFAQENSKPAFTADEVLRELMMGNANFVQEQAKNGAENGEKRESSLEKGLHPIAVVISCNDLKIAPEFIFGQKLGELFVIRNIGNVVDSNVLTGVEYATEHLQVPLVVVLGHTNCDSIKTAITEDKDLDHVLHLFDELEAVIEESKGQEGDLLENTIKNNVINVVKDLKKSKPLIKKQINKGEIKVVGAIYHSETGEVEIVSE